MKCGSKKRNVFVLFVSVSFNDISQFSNNNNNKKEGEPSIDPLSPLFFFFFFLPLSFSRCRLSLRTIGNLPRAL